MGYSDTIKGRIAFGEIAPYPCIINPVEKIIYAQLVGSYDDVHKLIQEGPEGLAKLLGLDLEDLEDL